MQENAKNTEKEEIEKKDTRPTWKVLASLLIGVAGTILIVVGGWKLLGFFIPFVVAWIISCIVHPLVNILEKRIKMKRKLGSAIIIILVIAAIVGLFYLIINRIYAEIRGLLLDFPIIYKRTSYTITQIMNRLDGGMNMLPDGIQNGITKAMSNLDTSVGDMISRFSEPTMLAAGNIAKKIPSYLIYTIVALMASYFFTADRGQILGWIREKTPVTILHKGTLMIQSLKKALGGYFKAQFEIMGVIACLLLIGLAILRVDFVILIALGIALLDFLPFFGTGTVLIPWALYELLSRNYRMMIGLAILYGVTQLVRQLIQPKLVGDSMGLNPMVTLLLLYIGYKVGSILGMILAVPVGMIVINMVQAGAFDYIINDLKALAIRIMELRER